MTSAYPLPSGYPEADDLEIAIDGRRAKAGRTRVADFVSCAIAGPVECSVTFPEPPQRVTIRPASAGIEPRVDGRTVAFMLDKPCKISVETPGRNPLYVFANAPETDVPDRNDPAVRWFAAGTAHEAGRIELRSGETLYIEPGAVVHGSVHARGASNVRVCGHGIIDGSRYRHHETRLLLFEHCTGVAVEGITAIGTPSWTIVLAACRGAAVRNVKLIGWVVCSDGVDIVGSSDVIVEDSFLHDNDDCIAVKSVTYPMRNDDVIDWRGDVRNVLVQRCVMHNDYAGNVMEIGFEPRADRIGDIVFRDCDVIAVRGHGAVFSIHNGDRALVENVLYENIRVEHYYDKLVDFRVLDSRYSKDHVRGRIRNVMLRNIAAVANTHNTVSLIGGFDEEHLVEHVTFDRFFLGGEKVRGADGLHLFAKYAKGIGFR